MPSLVKTNILSVRLGDRDARDLAELARLESAERNALVGESALLRELGMPLVRRRLARLRQKAA